MLPSRLAGTIPKYNLNTQGGRQKETETISTPEYFAQYYITTV